MMKPRFIVKGIGNGIVQRPTAFLLGVIVILATAMLGCSLSAAPLESGGAAPTADPADRYVSYPVSQLSLEPARQGATATPLADDVLTEARALDRVFINIYERINPSVVNIEIVGNNTIAGNITSSGSGFVYDTEGHIITNAHVVQDAREIIVTFSDGTVATADLVGLDAFSDLAVLRVDVAPERLLPVTIGDSNAVQVGQHVVAIGNPFGLKSSMTVGHVSATGRALPSEQLINSFDPNDVGVFNNPSIIQLDVSINPGNSGGPVLNLDAEVIGVAAAIRTETGIFQGVSFAVPSNTLKRIAPQLIRNGEVVYPFLGISSPPSDGGITVAALAQEYDLPVNNGVLVVEVLPNSPAAEAGLQGGDEEQVIRGRPVRLGGDIIVAVDGQPVQNLDELLAYLVQNTSPGDNILLTVVRGDQTLEIPVTVGERP